MNERRQINISVSQKVYERVGKMAAAAGRSITSYGTLLFEAAYSARCAETGDVDLDVAVSRVALLFGCGFDEDSIKQATGLSSEFVARTIEAWRGQMKASRPVYKTRVARAR